MSRLYGDNEDINSDKVKNFFADPDLKITISGEAEQTFDEIL